MPQKRLSAEAERWWFERIKKTRVGIEAVRYLRYKSLTDLVFFSRVMLEYDLVGDPWHYYLADWVERPGKRFKAALGPRQSYKSTLFQSWLMQRIIRDPDETALIVGANLSIGGGGLKDIAAKFESCRPFRAVWGDWVGSPWNWESLSVSRRQHGGKDPTIGIASLGRPMTSKHPKTILVDDLEAKETVESDSVKERSKSLFVNLFPLLRHEGFMLVNNAPWDHDGVVFGVILNPKKPYHKYFDLCVMPVEGTLDGKKVFAVPSIWPDEESIRRTIDLWTFSDAMSQLYLWPVGEGECRFDRSKIDDALFGAAPENMTTVCLVDPTGGDLKVHDFAAVVVLGMDVTEKIHVLEARQIHSTPGKIAHEAVELADLHDCQAIGVEANAGLIAFGGCIRDEMNLHPEKSRRVFALETRGRSKDARIANLVGLYEMGRLKIAAHLTEFIQQMCAYPAGKRDMIDAAAYFRDCPMLRPPRVRAPMSDEEKRRRELLKEEDVFMKDRTASRMDVRRMEAFGGIPSSML